MDRRRLALMVLGVVAVAVAGWWFLVRSDAPPAPDLASAVETASEAQAAIAAIVAKALMCPVVLSSHGVIQQPMMKPK